MTAGLMPKPRLGGLGTAMRLLLPAVVIVLLVTAAPMSALVGASDPSDPSPIPGQPTLTRSAALDLLAARVTADQAGADGPADGTPYWTQLTQQFVIVADPSPEATSGRTNGRATDTYAGVHHNLQVDTGASPYPSAALIASFQDTFDNEIYPTTTDYFGTTYDVVDIWVSDIGFNGGYFGPDGPTGIRIDDDAFGTWGEEVAAHEFYHLLQCDHDCDEDLWINEGTADVAILVNFGWAAAGGLRSHVDAYELVPEESLTSWGGSVTDYGQAFTYMQYLNEHFGGSAFMKPLVGSGSNGFGSISNQLSIAGSPKDAKAVWVDWLVANMVDNPGLADGEYGYTTFDVHPKTSTVSSYPYTPSSTSVGGYGARYYKFTNGDGQTLRMDLQGDPSIQPVLVIQGQLGTVVIEDQFGPIIDVSEFGSAGNSTVYLGVGATTGTSFTLTADLVDITPPRTTLQLSPAAPDDGAWFTVDPVVDFVVDDLAATTYFSWDGGEDVPFDGPSSVNVMQGKHDLTYWSVDLIGNIEIPRTVPLWVDSQPLITTLGLDPAQPDVNGWYTQPPSFSFTVDRPERLDRTVHTLGAEGEEVEGSGPFVAPEGLTELHFWSDGVTPGSQEQHQTSIIKVDTQAPIVVATVTPAEPDGLGGWYVTHPMVELSAPGEPGEVHYSYRFDAGGWLDYTGPILLPHGVTLLAFYGTDEVGHEGVPDTIELHVDLLGPTSDLVLDPEEPDGVDGWYVTSPSFDFQVDDDPETSIWYSWDEGNATPLGEEGVTMPQGEHSFAWWAVDPAGNNESSHVVALKLDSVAPGANHSLSEEPGLLGWLTHETKVTLTTDEAGASIMFRWDAEAFGAYAEPVAVPDGKPVLAYFAVDPAGNTGATTILRLKLDASKPKVEATLEPKSPQEGQRVMLDLAQSSDDDGIKRFMVDFGDGSDPVEVTTTKATHTYDKSGRFTLKVLAYDEAGNEGSLDLAVMVQSKPLVSLNGGGPGSASVLSGTALGLVALLAAIGVIAALFLMRRRRGKGAVALPAEGPQPFYQPASQGPVGPEGFGPQMGPAMGSLPQGLQPDGGQGPPGGAGPQSDGWTEVGR